MKALQNWFVGSSVTGDPDAMLILTWLAAIEDENATIEDGALFVLSPAIKNGRIVDLILGIPRLRAKAAVKRLIDHGELILITTDNLRGFKVKRLPKLVSDLALFGRRKYFRDMARKQSK